MWISVSSCSYTSRKSNLRMINSFLLWIYVTSTKEHDRRWFVLQLVPLRGEKVSCHIAMLTKQGTLTIQRKFPGRISGNWFPWANGTVNDTEQRVVIDGVNSSSCSIPPGVPQGSLLGPLFFVIFNQWPTRSCCSREHCVIIRWRLQNIKGDKLPSRSAFSISVWYW